MPELKLNQLNFQALFTIEGLTQLDQAFLAFLEKENSELKTQLIQYREKREITSSLTISHFLLAAAPFLEKFIAALFGIEESVEKLRADILSHDPIFQFKKYYVLTQAKRNFEKYHDETEFHETHDWLLHQLRIKNLNELDDPELSVATLAISFLKDSDTHQDHINQFTKWCVLAQKTETGKKIIRHWSSFHLPQKKQFENLVPIVPVPHDEIGRLEGPPETKRHRDGFGLTDCRKSEREVLDEIHYCVYCHKNEGDFCSKGFPVKKNQPELGLKIDPTGELLTGCPLEEKISEMHVLKKSGFNIGALAVVMIDNPMCAATGHRICNDCMKACIYQKQDPVNIPEIETRVLTDVLHLPWGVEIYDLLMRWNPLRQTQFLPKQYNGKKILVMGMGPAGFTLAHHLLMEGCAVVGADGLKIEPLHSELLTKPIHDFNQLTEKLDERVIAGFGGVAEYGITVRWDKNFLKLIYISLARRPYFQVFGNVRFGGSITIENAWQLGFDHVAIAVGAGLPRELKIPNSMSKGMRQANDFLMALQLTGAIKKNSLANLQVRLPAVVIGGGLTGIDTATEVQAYYITQVEKIHQRYHVLKNDLSEEKLRAQFDTASLEIIDEYLQHAETILKEREQAKKENRAPDLQMLIRAWGGVTIVYRKSMQESPAYKRNHEEMIKALEEGIYYTEGLEPKSVILDHDGAAQALVCRSRLQDQGGNWILSTEEKTLPAKSIFVATGASPNIAYEFEHRGTFQKHRMRYDRFTLENDHLEPAADDQHVKTDHIGIFTSYDRDHHHVSFIGDTNPVFHGSVVKAIASAKKSYSTIMHSLKNHPDHTENYAEFREKINALFESNIVSITRRTDNVVELTVYAPLAAQAFRPGQFYRIQNYEYLAKKIENTTLQTEAISALGISHDGDKNCLSFFIFENGASARLIATFQQDQPIALMGPTGAAVKIPQESKNILIIGDHFAIPYLLSVGPALKAAGHTIYFVTDISVTDLFAEKKIKAMTDQAYFCRDRHALISIALKNIPLDRMDTIHVIGTAPLLKSMEQAKNTILKTKINPKTNWIASVYGPMQCMLKGVCAQCLQWQIDPKTGQRTKAVYTCSWQHQPMEIVDINNLEDRLGQNRAQEILTNLWLDYLFDHAAVNRL